MIIWNTPHASTKKHANAEPICIRKTGCPGGCKNSKFFSIYCVFDIHEFFTTYGILDIARFLIILISGRLGCVSNEDCPANTFCFGFELCITTGKSNIST